LARRSGGAAVVILDLRISAALAAEAGELHKTGKSINLHKTRIHPEPFFPEKIVTEEHGGSRGFAGSARVPER
jgi:hypothetical protein